MIMVSESVLIWSGALTVVGVVVLGYVLAERRRGRRDRERLEEARRLGIDTPKGQYPYIDPDVCIGCGGCVSACPEGDVLGIVGGLAMVVNGMRCIGIGQCAKACPVGAVELRVGSLKGRADVPVMDDERQTNVPGVFIAGELGGLALIRNAVEQGRETVRSIAERLDGAPPSPGVLDLAIVGAGPSGLSAALSATERRLSYVLLEQESDFGGTIYQYPRRKLTHTQPVELPLYGTLKREEYTKEELLELFSGLVEEHRIELRLGERVLSLDRTDHDTFQIRTAGGGPPEVGKQNIHQARNVLLALGRRGTPRKLGVPGEQLPKVMYQVRDAAHYRRSRVLCVGGGDSAIEAAMGLARQPGNQVAISYRKEGFFRIKKKNEDRLAKLVKRGRIQLIMQSQVTEITETSVQLTTPEGEVALDNDFVFVLIGGIPPFKLLRDIGIQFGDEVQQAVC
jgi:putative YpdA family bacillithiol system oxidoreductase